MVQEISQRVRAIKPNIVISADVIPLIAGTDQGQNSIDWENKGLVDVLCRMAYYRDIDVELTDKIRGLLKNPDALTSLSRMCPPAMKCGPLASIYSRDGKWFARHDQYYSAALATDGVGVYEYKWLSDEQIAAIKAGPFKPPATPTGLGAK